MASADKESFLFWARLSCPCDERYCDMLGKDSALGHMRVEWSLTIWWNLSLRTGIGLSDLNLSLNLCVIQFEQHLSTASAQKGKAPRSHHYLSNSHPKLESSLTVAHLKTQMWHCTPCETWTPPKLRLEAWDSSPLSFNWNCSPGVRTYWNSGSLSWSRKNQCESKQ